MYCRRCFFYSPWKGPSKKINICLNVHSPYFKYFCCFISRSDSIFQHGTIDLFFRWSFWIFIYLYCLECDRGPKSSPCWWISPLWVVNPARSHDLSDLQKKIQEECRNKSEECRFSKWNCIHCHSIVVCTCSVWYTLSACWKLPTKNMYATFKDQIFFVNRFVWPLVKAFVPKDH